MNQENLKIAEELGIAMDNITTDEQLNAAIAEASKKVAGSVDLTAHAELVPFCVAIATAMGGNDRVAALTQFDQMVAQYGATKADAIAQIKEFAFPSQSAAIKAIAGTSREPSGSAFVIGDGFVEGVIRGEAYLKAIAQTNSLDTRAYANASPIDGNFNNVTKSNWKIEYQVGRVVGTVNVPLGQMAERFKGMTKSAAEAEILNRIFDDSYKGAESLSLQTAVPMSLKNENRFKTPTLVSGNSEDILLAMDYTEDAERAAELAGKMLGEGDMKSAVTNTHNWDNGDGKKEVSFADGQRFKGYVAKRTTRDGRTMPVLLVTELKLG